jgi:hypothetical protein
MMSDTPQCDVRGSSALPNSKDIYDCRRAIFINKINKLRILLSQPRNFNPN